MVDALAAGQVTCIACGETVAREAAREYDKHGDRWDREDKTFEYLCKPCFRGLSKQPRDGLETLLVSIGAGRVSDREFLGRFADRVADEERHRSE
ncbi:MAG: hypothetical protein ABEJ77_07075 [Halanaeroarchaeum sp.]